MTSDSGVEAFDDDTKYGRPDDPNFSYAIPLREAARELAKKINVVKHPSTRARRRPTPIIVERAIEELPLVAAAFSHLPAPGGMETGRAEYFLESLQGLALVAEIIEGSAPALAQRDLLRFAFFSVNPKTKRGVK